MVLGGDGSQLGVVHHDLTLRPLPIAAKMMGRLPDAAEERAAQSDSCVAI
jgi:hypothetical protein